MSSLWYEARELFEESNLLDLSNIERESIRRKTEPILNTLLHNNPQFKPYFQATGSGDPPIISRFHLESGSNAKTNHQNYQPKDQRAEAILKLEDKLDIIERELSSLDKKANNLMIHKIFSNNDDNNQWFLSNDKLWVINFIWPIIIYKFLAKFITDIG